MHFQVVFGYRRSHVLEFLHHTPQAVAVLAPRHQNGIGGRDHDDVLQAIKRDELLVGGDITAAGIDKQCRTLRGVVGRVARGQLPDRLPGADVGPSV